MSRWLCLLVSAIALAPAGTAYACGGFFCSSSPINQSREVVVYGLEEDGSLTMAVQVQYQGSDEDFAWILPVPVPPDEIAVGTDALFNQVIQATEPQFRLDRRTEGTCAAARCNFPSYGGGCGFGCGAGAPAYDRTATGADGAVMPPGVTVHSESVVGPYDTVVLGASTAGEVVEWLDDHAYDIPATSTELLEPYAAQGFVFVALRLTANRDSSVLRPVVLRMATDEACLPIRLTAVATTPDLPIVTVFLGDAQVAPRNYSHADVAVDPALWLGGLSWDAAVRARVEELGGQAFATDYADATPTVSIAMEPIADLASEPDPALLLAELQRRGYRGSPLLLDLLSAHLVPPDGEDPMTYFNCLSRSSTRSCGAPSRFDPEGLVRAVENGLTIPAREAQDLVDRHGYLTRLSTTMRAEDMTIDPVFATEGALPDVPQLRQATLVTHCDDSHFEISAPQTLEVGDEVYDVREGRAISEEMACQEMGGTLATGSGGCSSTVGAPTRTALLLVMISALVAFRVRRRRG